MPSHPGQLKPESKPPWRIRVLALSRPLPPEALAALAQFFPSEHIALSIDPSCYGTGWFSGSDAERARLFTQTFHDPQVDAIWIARGGYGHARLLEHLNPADFPDYEDGGNETPVIGYSDVTALMLWLYRHTGAELIHAPMPIDLLRPELAADIAALFTGLAVPESGGFGGEIPLTWLRQGHDKIYGPVLAANLTLLTNAIGTAWQPDLNRHILVLEDVDESLYRLDRMFTQLRQSGILRGLKALVLGDFTLPHENGAAFPYSVTDMALHSVDCPVLIGAPIGHGARNRPICQGTHGVLSTDGRLSLDGTLW